MFVEATDGVNVSYSANKGENFTSTNSNTPPGGAQIFLKAPVGPYSQGQTVNATYQCGTAVRSASAPCRAGARSTPRRRRAHVRRQRLRLGRERHRLAPAQYSVDYPFNGFFRPSTTCRLLNVAKAGSAIPVKFSLGGNQGLNIFCVSTYPKSQTDHLQTTAPLDRSRRR